jgi:molybdopterin-guanine dinucleotide biosynthesis protein A
MGMEKGALPFGPETMLERVLRLVAETTDSVVVAAAARQRVRVPDRFPVTRDLTEDDGPLPGLLRGAEQLDTELVFAVACDTPLLEPALIPLLSSLAAGWDGAVPVIDGQRAILSAVYRRTALLSAREGFGDARGQSLHGYLSRLRVREVEDSILRRVDPELRSFLPCNTPHEYRRALRLAGFPVNDQTPPAV